MAKVQSKTLDGCQVIDFDKYKEKQILQIIQKEYPQFSSDDIKKYIEFNKKKFYPQWDRILSEVLLDISGAYIIRKIR